ncbi:MAG: PilZ domain-containing protein [Actinobacteria bacterium]|nr:PilZ domain-containing protein [Actinomycetota bacterium]
MREKRKFARIDKKTLIEFRELKHPIEEKKYILSNIKDISGSGLLFQSEKEYKIGTFLHLKIALTGGKEDNPRFRKIGEASLCHPISIIGRVVRIEELKKGASYDIGIRFVNFYENDAAGLINFINKNLEH